MNRARLEHTARQVLPYVDDFAFNMTVWDCDSYACAFGHEARSAHGRANGLTLQPRVTAGPFGLVPVYRGHSRGIMATAMYYEIDLRDAHWLFSPASYEDVDEDVEMIGPVEVAVRIETILACDS